MILPPNDKCDFDLTKWSGKADPSGLPKGPGALTRNIAGLKAKAQVKEGDGPMLLG